MNIKMTTHRSMLISGRTIIAFCIFLVLPTISLGVTTTHYDKPPDAKVLPQSDTKVEKLHKRIANLTVAERQKRLLPYINFYLSQQINQPYNDEIVYNNQRYRLVPAKIAGYQPPHQNNQFSELVAATYQPSDKTYEAQQILHQSKTKFTPFLESNALPGPFTPMVRTQPQKTKITYVPIEQIEKIPNFSSIYDKLSQLKLQHSAFEAQIAQHNTKQSTPQYIIRKKPQISFIPVHEIQDPTSYAPIESPKAYLNTYTPTSVEVSNNGGNTMYDSQDYDEGDQISTKINSENQKQVPITVTQIPIRITQINDPQQHIPTEQIQIIEEPVRLVPQQNFISPPLKKHPQLQYVVHEQKPYHTQNHKQYLQEVVPNSKPPIILVPQKTVQQYHYAETPKQDVHVQTPIKVAKPIIIFQPTITQTKQYVPEPIVTPTYQPITTNHEIPQIVTPAPPPPIEIPTENPNSLNTILRRLQESNALPQTLTPDNIDNSIKTLVRILTSLKKQQQLTASPIVVADESGSYEEQDNEAGVNLGETQGEFPPGTIVQSFPANTPEGGTPGKPGVDYPALSTIPQTKFNCKTQRYKGFFADPDTHCQVWHYCDLNGGQASFLCPNGTIFSQVALTCDWWFNVKCSTTTQLYVLNERLYKYIIPLTPKFPEDYTGPLVDRYLALKFKEMEEKMKEEKKKKPKDEKTTDEIDELQLLEDQNMEHSNRQSTEQAEDEDHTK